MKTKIQIIFYSMYGHVFKMAESVLKGVEEVTDVEGELFQIPELVPESILEKSGAAAARKKFSQIPFATPEQLANADGVIFGTPTRYGNMCAQMRNFLDQTGGLWMKNSLVGKLASVFASTGTQHGGQETTITSFHTTLFHLGFIIAGVPYSESRLTNMNEITGGTPYGATTLAGADGKREPSANELSIAQFQGKYVAEIAKALKIGRQKV
ncbi:MAG TPA: NAD(P)H:quinone oxidoreductase [Gammaproteobacteria bacterium]|nr:NAD(P)H:quinone oxidoreductase [Gammaproteobacteria bacterium]